MKKKSLLFIIITLLLFININVDAATCTTQEKNALRQEARNLEIIPVLDNDTEVSQWHTHRYSVNFTNLSDEFYILDSEGTKYQYTSSHTSETLYGSYKPNSTEMFKVYGAVGKTCAFEHLATIRVKFEPYNDYYLLSICEGIEEFELCQRNYAGTIESEEWFEEQVIKYKESLNKKPVEEQEKGIIEKVVTYLSENPLIVIGIVMVLILVIILIIIKVKKDKKRIKVNLDLK